MVQDTVSTNLQHESRGLMTQNNNVYNMIEKKTHIGTYIYIYIYIYERI